MQTLKNPPPIDLERVRSLPKSFSWIDRQLIMKNILAYLTGDEIALYFFLTTAADRKGMSFYGAPRICRNLGMSHEALRQATCGLVKLDLIAYRCPFFQVLALPEKMERNRFALKRLLERDRP